MKVAYVVATYPVGQPKVFRNAQFYTRPAPTQNRLLAFTDVRLAERWRTWVSDETRKYCVLHELDVEYLSEKLLKMPVDYNLPRKRLFGSCNASEIDTGPRRRNKKGPTE